MNRLIVNPDTANSWEIPLPPGVTSLGRSPENTFPLEHPSVSAAHCQVSVMNAGVILKDLGSNHGTYVDEQPVDEAVLLPGQTIRVGEVVMRFESDPVAPIAPGVPAGISLPTNAACKIHRKSPAKYMCPKCRNSFCPVCVSSRRDEGRMGHFCKTCSVECLTLETQTARPVEEEVSFARQAWSAFGYPLKGDGMVLLLVGGILFLLIDGARYLAKFAFMYGLVALIILNVFGTGYLVSYMRRIISSSAGGEDIMPDWPELSDIAGDLLSPFFQFLGTVLFCFLPTILLFIFAPDDSPWLGWAAFTTILFGCIYFPMAFMAVGMFDSVMALNPLLIIPSILNVPLEYLITILLFGLVLLVRWAGYEFVPLILPIPVVPWIISGFLGLYILIVEMRILGLLYRNRKAELGWFNR